MIRALSLFALTATGLSVACASRSPAGFRVPEIAEADESRLIARVGGCAFRSATWIDKQLRRDRPEIWARLVECASERSCKALATCAGVEIAGGTRVEESCKPSCIDGVEESCDAGPRIRDTCARTGRVCSTRAPRCTAPGAKPCSDPSASRCEADQPITCSSGEEVVGSHCAERGRVCFVPPAPPSPPSPPFPAANAAGDLANTPAPESLARCRGVGPACGWGVRGAFTQDGDAFQCDGDALVSCSGGRIHREDCARLVPGSRCRAIGDPERPRFACLRDTECDPHRKGFAHCEDKTSVFCNAGRIARVDCDAVGFATCFGSGCFGEKSGLLD